MKKNSTTNTFTDGLIMDFDPLVAPNTALSSALNATLITMNGKENVLQNDMGNCQVETAKLPSGYIPVGTTELGGIIYIVSYNPLIDRCQIGSFPSPERNISSDELGNDGVTVDINTFLTENETTVKTPDLQEELDSLPDIIKIIQRDKLGELTLHSGDKFIVYQDSNNTFNPQEVSCYNNDQFESHYYKFSLGTLDSNNRLVYLKDLIHIPFEETSSYSLDIHPNKETYKDVYNVYNSKIAGELYLITELEVLDTFDSTWELNNIDNSTYTIDINCSYTSSNGISPTYIDVQYDDIIRRYEWSTDIQFVIKNPKDSKVSLQVTPVLAYGRQISLTNTLSFDTSLFGSDIVNFTEWKYYKENLQMIISFAIESYLTSSNRIKSIRFDFNPVSDIENTQKTITIEKRKSYSGHYTQTILFGENFLENTLYKVYISIFYGELLAEKIITKWLYTNGVFNTNWINSEATDYDKLYLPLELTLNSNYKNNITTNSLSTSDDIYTDSNTESYIKGRTATTIEGDILLNNKLELKNTYNSFSTNTEADSIEQTEKTTVTFTKQMYNTGLQVTGEVENYLNLDTPEITTSLKENVLSIKASDSFKNPIIADKTKKTISVSTKYKPICSNLEELAEYNIIKNDANVLDMGNTYIGLGMSNGGTDNQGGGGIFHVQGTVDLGLSESDIIQEHADPQNPTEESGIDGYNKLPDTSLSTFIANKSDNCSIVPVLLVNAGTDRFYLLTNSLPETEIYTEQAQRPKGGNKRVEWFSDKQKSSYRWLWLFMKSSDSSNSYVPLSNFIRIFYDKDTKDIRTWAKTNVKVDEEGNETFNKVITTVPNLITSILTQLYVTKTGDTVDKYTVNNFVTYRNLTAIITIPIKINYTGIPNIYIQGELLNILGGENCLRTEEIKESLMDNITLTIEIPNLLYDSYQSFYMGGRIDSAVDCTQLDENKQIISIKPPTTKTGTLYYIDADNTVLKPLDDKVKIHLINIFEINSGIINYIPSNNILSLADISTLLMFGSRTQKLVINSSQYKLKQNKQAIWGTKGYSTESEYAFMDQGTRTTWKDAYLFNDFLMGE